MAPARPRLHAVMLLALAGTARAGVCIEQNDQALIAALRDDDTPWNASRASHELCTKPDPPIAALQRALDSDDWQQRQMAAGVLWWRLHPPVWVDTEPVGELTPRLLHVTVEGLAHNALPHDPEAGRYTFEFNASRGVRMLVLHADEARQWLEAGIKSGDPQQRFLCALALGLGGVSESATLVVPVLLPHLADNHIPEDAKWATAALYRLGPRARPALAEALPDADAQQESLIRLIMHDWSSPPLSRADLENRRGWHAITTIVFDPAVEPPRDDWMGWVGLISADTAEAKTDASGTPGVGDPAATTLD